jgi:UDP-3-O-[3-hydroxymyristoyl] N-acetylglucosamine deacetylase
LVEHLLAAVGGLSVQSSVLIAVDGPELPLLDGGSAVFADALLRLCAPSALPPVRITRRETLRQGDSLYHFVPAPQVGLRVSVRFDHPNIGTQHASWDGTAEAFVRDIAPARTFGFRAQAAELWERGRALLCASPEGLTAFERAVLVFDDQPGSGPDALPDEIARHKLLDLIGDFTLHGGPPIGQVHAERPGHAATHQVIIAALASGLLERS